MKKMTSLLLTVIALGLLYISLQKTVVGVQPENAPFLDSPLPTPSPVPLSPEAQLALEFVATQKGIPLAQLEFGSEEQLVFPLLKRKYTYVTVHYNQLNAFQLFSLLVDPVTKEIEADFNAVRAAEELAHRNKYGKFEPALYERLQEVDENAMLPIAVWVAHTVHEKPQEEIEAEIISRYPAADEALKQKGVLWAVDDSNLSIEIQQAYDQLLMENAAVRIQPIVDRLKEKGVAVTTVPGMPGVHGTLLKSIITDLGDQSNVAQIFLTEVEETQASDIAIPTDRVSAVWSRGITGSGVRIAILERPNINATADACLDIIVTRTSVADPDGHKSRVAANTACNDSLLRGSAYGSQILDAGHNGTQQDAIEALKWATDPTSANRANVVNHSASFEGDNVLHFTDRAYDYWVKYRSFTAVVAAGNNSGNVTSPGKAYNVITVGNLNDQNTVSWSDDVMASDSSFQNPNTAVEKPEVAAPGSGISSVAGTASGTSHAAPQVSGLAALLMQRDGDLKNFPTAIKAIIIASAVHNIEGDQRLSDRDGAGAINAALADTIAQTEGNTGVCNAPCWWNIPTTNSFPARSGSVERTFTANRGERIRVAIAWLSLPDAPTDTSPDLLYRNFDLHVITPGGGTNLSESATNNFEIVDFIAPSTGQYTIRVVRNASGDRGDEFAGNLLGIAWTKQSLVYAPDVRRNSGGWTSSIYVRNDAAEQRHARILFYNDNGTLAGEATQVVIPANTVWSTATIPNNWLGSAVVEGDGNFSVSVANQRSPSPYSSGSFAGIPDTKASPLFYLPLAMRKVSTASGTANSVIFIQNAGNVNAVVSIQMIGTPVNWTKPDVTILPGAALRYDLETEAPGNLPDGWYGSVRVNMTSGARIAVMSNFKSGSDSVQSYQGLPSESVGTTWVVPLFTSRLANGLSTPVAIQNISGAQINNGGVTLSCVKDPGSPNPTALNVTNSVAIPTNGAFYFNPVTDTTNFPTGWYGACRVTSTGNIVSFVQMRFVGATNAAAYESIRASGSSKILIFPLVQKRVSTGAGILGTSLAVQNLSTTAAANVRLTYYRASGSPGLTFYVDCSIAAGASIIHNHRLTDPNATNCVLNGNTMSDGWYGSLVVTSSNQPIDGFIQLTNVSNPAGDTFMAHNASTSP
jgi:hypothetical protein